MSLSINTAFPATQSGTWNVNTGLLQSLTDTQLRATPVPVTLTNTAFIASALITRPANTTPYIANDVYGSVFELQNIGTAGNFVFLHSLDIIFNISAVPSGMTSFTIYLYNVTPPSAVTDNNPFSVPSGDRSSLLTPAGIRLSASLAKGGGSVVAELSGINRLFRTVTSSLWGYVVTDGGFTPANNSETFTIRARSFAP